jgi:dihydroneopterin aldolase
MVNGHDCNEIVINAVSSWQYLARTKDDIDALKRLVKYPSVSEAWDKLANKTDRDKFERLASYIVRAAIGAHLRQSELPPEFRLPRVT